jgi:TRAP-type C4-dicarboxylate transport system substrate-binding protein
MKDPCLEGATHRSGKPPGRLFPSLCRVCAAYAGAGVLFLCILSGVAVHPVRAQHSGEAPEYPTATEHPATPMTVPVMRISVENSESHVHTRVVRAFTERLQERLAGRLDVRLFTDGELFRDTDIPVALSQGRVEMAVPGIWHLDRYVPDVSLFLLPMFYGAPPDVSHRLGDGETGQIINSRIELRLSVEVIGRWIDLGYVHIFSNRNPVTGYPDLSGRVIRVAGGRANEMRIAALGAKPVVVAWQDLPFRLGRETLDGVLTSYETVVSAGLWEHGIVGAFEDRQYFARYLPMVSREFWLRLDPEVRRIIREAWDEGVETARAEAARAQRLAKEEAINAGVVVYVPNHNEKNEAWTRLLSHQARIVENLRIDESLVERAMQELADVREAGNRYGAHVPSEQ